MGHRITRSQYAAQYGPSTGQKVRLGDTALVAEVERDSAVPGDEAVYGAALSLRGTCGLSAPREDSLDSVITNVLVIDWTGIFKADIGIKDGRIAGLGKAGHPNIMSNVTPGLEIGATTQVFSGEGLIATAGAIDSNCPLNAPNLLESALSGGVTTVIGGGAGHFGNFAPDGTMPGARHIEMMLRATDHLPLNVGLLARAGAPQPHALIEQIRAGAAGLHLTDCWGSSSTALDCALAVSIQFDLPVSLTTGGFNESGNYEELINTLQGRPVRLNLTHCSGGGPTPDALRACAENRILGVSSSGALPASMNTLEEIRASLAARLRLDPKNPNDAAFIESATRGGTLAAEDILHDLGAIPIVASGAQASGRIGDMVARVWQCAHKMLKQRGRLAGENGANDNLRIRRYIAKYTINPALACGIAHETGSLQEGKLADVVLWKPAFFGRRPEAVIKGGILVWSQSGVPSAGMPKVQPVRERPNFGAAPGATADCSVAFVSKHSLREKVAETFGLKKPLAAVMKWRKIGKHDMKLNDVDPRIAVDLHNLSVSVNNEMMTSTPSENLPLAQRYSLF